MTSEYRCYVFAYPDGHAQAVPAGDLFLLEEGPRVVASTFGFGRRYLQRTNAVPVDPISLPLQGAVAGDRRRYEPHNGLSMFGAIRDAMPDAWGRRVIENRLRAPANGLPESVYLEHAGSNRLGALDFRKSLDAEESAGLLVPVAELAYLQDAADRVMRGEPVPAALQKIFDAGPSMGGARPKAVVTRDGRQFIAKFPAQDDPFNIPLIEWATLELARICGLRVPATERASMPNGSTVMLIERFDRTLVPGGWARRPVVSALTMLGLHASESPTSSYAAISQAIGQFGAAGHVAEDRAELFARMVFNILVTNDDDHLRNHAFVWEAAIGGWRLSPLYDVVPKPQVATQRYLHLGVGPLGRLATLDNALQAGPMFGLRSEMAKEIVGRIAREVREWRTHFEAMGIDKKECDKVQTAFRRPRDVGWT